MTVHRTNPEMWVGDMPGADAAWRELVAGLPEETVTLSGYFVPDGQCWECRADFLVVEGDRCFCPGCGYDATVTAP